MQSINSSEISMDIACIDYRTELPKAEQFAALFAPLNWFPDRSIEEFRRSLAGSWYCVCAYDGEQLVGFGRVISDGVIHALLTEVAVMTTHRRRGIGRAIVSRLVERCVAADIQQIQLFSAAGKIPFYQRLGFEPRAAERPGMQYGISRISPGKRLEEDRPGGPGHRSIELTGSEQPT